MAATDITADVVFLEGPPSTEVGEFYENPLITYYYPLFIGPGCSSSGGGGSSGDCDDRPDTGMLYPRG